MQNHQWNDEQLMRYSRHILLDEIGLEGQEKIIQSTVFVLGCGGLGAAVLPYLAAAGVGKLIIADDDEIELSNLQRQITYTEQDIGQAKVVAMKQKLQAINPHCKIETYSCTMTPSLLQEIVPQCDVIVDCGDRFSSRQAMNYAALSCGVPLVSGAAIRFQGQLAVFPFHQPHAACYHCLFGGEEASDGACALLGVFSPLVGVVGSMQAIETLKLLLGKPINKNVLHCYHAWQGHWQTFPFEPDPSCPVCSRISKLPEKSSF